MPPVAWGLVVPVKRLALAKTRLQAYGDVLRQDLALAFAVDVVTAALASDAVEHVLVVTDDERARVALSGAGAVVVSDGPDAGLNPALAHGANLLPAGLGAATVSADLPALRPDELTAALRAVPADRRAFVADAAGTGTTLLAAPVGQSLAPAYGQSSRDGHLVSGAAELPAGAGLRLDVDTPDDLRRALALGVGGATAAVAARLG
ncbi:MAG: 2-phospho-L-lactate guanylyltransferase [Actinobacteria bacterium]|nr:2-phospho-L-lactate guanylyltransferase [Actinomycetota bacterium]MCA1722500.1 2-phospho-L-lactate guanylyltransferase [Actinomycetota bacterium]